MIIQRSEGLRFRPGEMAPLFGDTAAALIVDDDDDASAMARLLTSAGYRCTCTADAAAAHALLADGTFALVLVEVMMAGETGLELAESILATQSDLAVVMVANVDDPSIAELAFDSGAYGYVVKPFRPNELLITVANAGRRRCLEIIHRAYEHRLEHLVHEQALDLNEARTRLGQVAAARSDGVRPVRGPIGDDGS